MNIQFLIDSIVRQTTVLIAQLATSGGARAPLAHVANQVFLDLSQALEQQGIGRKVGADMFGMALRSYQRKLARLGESASHRGHSLWEAIFDFLNERKVATRAEIMIRFHADDETLVRGVLHDLTETGLVFRAGSSHSAIYRVATDEDLGMLGESDETRGTDALVWLAVYRHGPIHRDDLAQLVGRPVAELEASLDRLMNEGRVSKQERLEGSVFHSREFLVQFGGATGWGAAVFDHFQAMVQTICQRLAGDDLRPAIKDIVGGSTYSFEVWDGHEMADEVYTTLRGFRERLTALRARIDEYNQGRNIPRQYNDVIIYAGQCVMTRESALEEADNETPV